MAELIEMPVGIWARMESRNHVLGGGPDHSRRIGSFGGNVCWPTAECREYPVCGRYTQPYFVYGSSE